MNKWKASTHRSVQNSIVILFSNLVKEQAEVVLSSFSHDRKFIIKTMTQQELDLYLAKLPAFS